MPQIFISYSRIDRPICLQIAPKLRRMYGHNAVWYDDALHGGEIWWSEILAWVQQCDIFVFLISRDALKSMYCKTELEEALKLGKHVLPVLIRAKTKLPANLKHIHYVDMSEGVNADNLTELLSSVHQLAERLQRSAPLEANNLAEQEADEVAESPTIDEVINANDPINIPDSSSDDGSVSSEMSIVVQEPFSRDRHPAIVYLAQKPSENSRRGLRNSLNTITDILYPGRFIAPSKTAPREERDTYHNRFLLVDYSGLRYQHVAAVRSSLMQKGYAPASVNHALSALRGVLKECWRLGYITAEDYHKSVDIQNIKAHTNPAGRDLSTGELSALSYACMDDPTPHGVRDGAIIALLAVCGLRRAELTGLDRFDFDGVDKITVRSGKGRKDRTVYVSGGALAALNDWIGIRGNKAGALFIPITRGGKLELKRPMTEQAIYKMLHKRADQAGVRDFSPHDLRRTVAGDLLDAGVDIVTVANILGHADVNTTRRYDRRPEDIKRVAAGKLNFTYQQRRKKKDE